MHAFHFGSASKRLFGIYHPAAGPRRGGVGVVICQPYGHEYVRAHRALRNLSARLGAGGVHVLRFDYYGTGDSYGDGREGRLEQWRHDTAAAVDELRDMAELPRVSLVGVRLGGLIAADVAAKRSDVDALVLWDPVVDGAAYLRASRTVEAGWQATRPWMEPAGRLGDRELIGFPLPQELESELQSASLTDMRRWPNRVVVTTSRGIDAAPLLGALETASVQPSVIAVDCDCEWERPSAVHLTLLAHDMVQEVASQLVGSRVAV